MMEFDKIHLTLNYAMGFEYNSMKVVINRYAKGNNRYQAKNLSEKIYIPDEVVGGDESEDEWGHFQLTK